MDPAAQGVIASRFRIIREVGRGAVGIVYRATDLFSGLEVALKIIASTGVEPAEHARFAREGQLLAELNHPGIVRVVAFGALESSTIDAVGRRLEEGSPYVAMEWLEGEDLQARQRHAPLELRQALEVGRQIAGALAAAHDAGIVHRDIKPSNIFLLDGGAESPSSGVFTPGDPRPSIRAKLVDFGV